MAYYPTRHSMRRGFGRPLTVRSNDSAGLTLMFLIVLAMGFLVARSAAQSLDLGTPNAARLTKALGYGAPDRLLVGYDPAVPSQSASRDAQVLAPPVIQTPPEPASPALAAPAEPPASDRLRVTNTDGLGVVLHTAPRKDARVPRGLLEGTRVTVLERSGDDWAHVRADNGQEGWVPSQYLAP